MYTINNENISRIVTIKSNIYESPTSTKYIDRNFENSTWGMVIEDGKWIQKKLKEGNGNHCFYSFIGNFCSRIISSIGISYLHKEMVSQR